jgi:hypothetical protein
MDIGDTLWTNVHRPPDVRYGCRTSAALSESWWQIFSINSLPLPFIPHSFFSPWYAPRLPEPFLGVLREKSVRKSVDREFRGKGSMSMLSFGVSYILFVVISWLCFNTDFKVTIVHSFRIYNVFKELFQRIVNLCFLALHVLFC